MILNIYLYLRIRNAFLLYFPETIWSLDFLTVCDQFLPLWTNNCIESYRFLYATLVRFCDFFSLTVEVISDLSPYLCCTGSNFLLQLFSHRKHRCVFYRAAFSQFINSPSYYFCPFVFISLSHTQLWPLLKVSIVADQMNDVYVSLYLTVFLQTNLFITKFNLECSDELLRLASFQTSPEFSDSNGAPRTLPVQHGKETIPRIKSSRGSTAKSWNSLYNMLYDTIPEEFLSGEVQPFAWKQNCSEKPPLWPEWALPL